MTISAHILLAIKRIFASNEGRLSIATGYLNQYSDDLGTLYPLLDDLCNCNFQTLAGLKNVIPTRSEANAINSALFEAGAAIPADAICGKVGTLGSFYSCTFNPATTVATRTLIATGSELCADKILAQQNCTNWAKSKAFYDYGSNLKFDAIATVYASNSASGSCFRVNGGMKTSQRIIIADGIIGNIIVPSLDITCSASTGACTTKATTVFTTTGLSTTFPALTVSCDAAGNSCSTNSITAAQAAANSVFTINGMIYPTSIPSLSVDFISPTAGSLSDLCQYYLDVA